HAPAQPEEWRDYRLPFPRGGIRGARRARRDRIRISVLRHRRLALHERRKLRPDPPGTRSARRRGGLPAPRDSPEARIFEGKPMGVILPDTVDLVVLDTEPTMQKATASAVMKPAKLETGLVISVPPFINNGDKVRVDTSEGRYVQRAQ